MERNTFLEYNLVSCLERSASLYPDKGITYVATSSGSERFVSYARLLDEARGFAAVLMRKGFKPKDKVLLMNSRAEYFVAALWGCLLAGVVPAPLPAVKNMNPDSIQFKRFTAAFEVMNVPVICDARDQSSYGVLTEIVASRGIELFNVADILAEALLSQDGSTIGYRAEKHDTAVIQFSSGSTADPKGIELTHYNVVSNIKSKAASEKTEESDCLIHWVPYFHDFGLFGCHFYAVVLGIPQVRIDPMHFVINPLLWLKKIEEHKATLTTSTNTGLELTAHAVRKNKKETLNLSSLRSIILGAEMLSMDICREFSESVQGYGLKPEALTPGYGLAEATLAVTAVENDEVATSCVVDRTNIAEGLVIYKDKDDVQGVEFVNVGRAVEGMQVRIVDESGNILPPDRVGEVEVLGGSVMKGYCNNLQATSSSFHDGWLRTGDLGFVDAEGSLYITGRKKELIIKNGLNFFPTDVEHLALKALEGRLSQCYVGGYYDASLHKEIIVLFLMKTKETLAEISLMATDVQHYLVQMLGFSIDYFVPIRTGQLPKTSSAKIMRVQLVENFRKNMFDDVIEASALGGSQQAQNEASEVDHECTLRSVWQQALELTEMKKNSLGFADSFFSHGGDSIRTVKALALLESIYGVKLDVDFFYTHATLKEQLDYFATRDASLVPPADELEYLVQVIVANSLQVSRDDVSVTENFMKKATRVSDVLQISEEIKNVFHLDAVPQEMLEHTSVREIALYLKGTYFYQGENNAAVTFPLMNFQETLYFHSKGFLRNEPTGLSCYIVYRIPLAGAFDIDVYNKAFSHLIKKHAMLRTVIDESAEMPCFKTYTNVPAFEARYEDISSRSKEEQDAFFRENDRNDHNYRFDATDYPLLYSHVYKIAPDMHQVVIHIDHLLIDGYSFVQLVKELFEVYDFILAEGKAPALEPAGMEFKDYVKIEKLRERTAEYKDAMAFSLDVFKDVPPKISLPFKNNPAMLEKVEFDTYHTTMPSEVMQGLVEISNQYADISLNALLLACYFKLMNLWSGQNDLIINMPIYNREHHFPHARSVVGSFLDIFPVRVKTSSEENIVSLARKVEKFTRVLLRYPVSSIELTRRIAERDRLEQGSLSSIIFSNSINMITDDVLSSSNSFELDLPVVHTGAPGTYLDLVMYTWKGKWIFDWNYVTALFDKDFVATFSSQYTKMLISFVDDYRHNRLKDPFNCQYLLPRDFKELLQENNRTEYACPQSTLHAWFEAQAKEYSEKIAIIHDDQQISYAELDQRSNQMAHFLRSKGVVKNQFVVFVMNRSIELLVAQLGVLKAGAAYVPVDPAYPSERTSYIIDDANAAVVITDMSCLSIVEKLQIGDVDCCCVMDAKEDLPAIAHVKVCSNKDIVAYAKDSLPAQSTPDDLAYMIYTSGSTGQPKGVMVRHRNVVNFLYYVQQQFSISDSDRVAFLTSYSFDMTITSNWVPLLSGACTHILSEEKTKNVEEILYFLSAHEITFLNVTPSHFSLMVHTLAYLDEDLPMYPEMTIMLGAEVIHVSELNTWLQKYPGHGFINEYGPTEATVASTFFPIPVNGTHQCELDIVPIGKPIYNTQVYILDDNLQPCMPGVAGILYLGGAGVTKGYRNKDEKTREAFVVNPLTGNPDDIVYMTGDLAKFADDGNIIFLGRKDYQVNLRGYRIEIGEIEKAVEDYPEVSEACVVVQKDSNGHEALVAFYTAKDDPEVSEDALQKFLEARLPEYMLPACFQRLGEMPLTTGGKVDRKSLPQGVLNTRSTAETAYVAPATETEKRMAVIWEEVLAVPRLSVDDNFWRLGGDSVKAVRLVQKMKEAGYTAIRIGDIFSAPTVKSMSAQIDGQEVVLVEDEHNIVQMTFPENPEVTLFCLPYAAGNAGMYQKFAEMLPETYRIFSAQYPGHGDERKVLSSVQEIASLYLPYVKKYADRPLCIMGYSFGGYVAHELLKQCEEQEIHVSALLQVAVTPPGYTDELMRLVEMNSKEAVSFSLESNIVDQEFLSLLSQEEIEKYMGLLRVDTSGMLGYTFDRHKLKTPALFLVGDDEEDVSIKDHQAQWYDYFQSCSFEKLPGNHLLIKDYADQLAARTTSFIARLICSETVN